jgi:hypothetical protein
VFDSWILTRKKKREFNQKRRIFNCYHEQIQKKLKNEFRKTARRRFREDRSLERRFMKED